MLHEFPDNLSIPQHNKKREIVLMWFVIPALWAAAAATTLEFKPVNHQRRIAVPYCQEQSVADYIFQFSVTGFNRGGIGPDAIEAGNFREPGTVVQFLVFGAPHRGADVVEKHSELPVLPPTGALCNGDGRSLVRLEQVGLRWYAWPPHP
jgi:hypothetical protein